MESKSESRCSSPAADHGTWTDTSEEKNTELSDLLGFQTSFESAASSGTSTSKRPVVISAPPSDNDTRYSVIRKKSGGLAQNFRRSLGPSIHPSIRAQTSSGHYSAGVPLISQQSILHDEKQPKLKEREEESAEGYTLKKTLIGLSWGNNYRRNRMAFLREPRKLNSVLSPHLGPIHYDKKHQELNEREETAGSSARSEHRFPGKDDKLIRPGKPIYTSEMTADEELIDKMKENTAGGGVKAEPYDLKGREESTGEDNTDVGADFFEFNEQFNPSMMSFLGTHETSMLSLEKEAQLNTLKGKEKTSGTKTEVPVNSLPCEEIFGCLGDVTEERPTHTFLNEPLFDTDSLLDAVPRGMISGEGETSGESGRAVSEESEPTPDDSCKMQEKADEFPAFSPLLVHQGFVKYFTKTGEDQHQMFTPFITDDFDDETYRFQCSHPGLYQCTVTSLMFHMEGEGEVLYRILTWNRRLLSQHHKKPAGPLFDIKCPQMSMSQLHLPHCEILSTGGGAFLSVAHVNDEGTEFIKPHKITETHVIINITGFSAFGNVKDEDSPPDPVQALVLLFYIPVNGNPYRALLSVLLVPRNIVIRDVQRTRRKLNGPETYIEVCPQCKLKPKQVYILSTSHKSPLVKVQPTEAEFDGEIHNSYFPSFQVLFKATIVDITLSLTEKSSSYCVWEREACLVASTATTLTLTSFQKLVNIRCDFINRVSGPVLQSLLDTLLQTKVINDPERESAEAMQRSDKARWVLDTVRNKGEAASSKMMEFLCELDPFFSEHLGLKPKQLEQ